MIFLLFTPLSWRHKFVKNFELKTRQVYFIYTAETRKIFTKHAVSIFFLLKWKASFLQNKNWLHVQDFVYKTLQLVRISLLIHNKEFYVFS